MFLLTCDMKDVKTKTLFRSWTNPGSHHRRMPEGYILHRLSVNALLMGDEALRFIDWYHSAYPGRFRVFQVEELSSEEVGQMVIDRAKARRARASSF